MECVDQSDAKYTEALASATGVILANEYAPDVLEETKSLLAAVAAGKCPNLKRVVLLSHIGVCRRDVDPWKFMNRKTKTGTGVIGAVPKDGGAPLDKWFEAENLVREAAGDFPIADDGSAPDGAGDGAGVNSVDLAPGAFTYTVVRVGDLRGNGPTSVTYGDAMLTLVDNAFDVRMQDIEIEEGDAFEGFTKRLSVAVTANRMLTSTQNRVLNKTFSLISTGPVDRERRKGWDVAKGRSPPPLEDSVVDEEIAPKEEEGGGGRARARAHVNVITKGVYKKSNVRLSSYYLRYDATRSTSLLALCITSAPLSPHPRSPPRVSRARPRTTPRPPRPGARPSTRTGWRPPRR